MGSFIDTLLDMLIWFFPSELFGTNKPWKRKGCFEKGCFIGCFLFLIIGAIAAYVWFRATQQ